MRSKVIFIINKTKLSDLIVLRVPTSSEKSVISDFITNYYPFTMSEHFESIFNMRNEYLKEKFISM